MKLRKLKKVIKFAANNYILLIFFGIIVLVSLVSTYKLFFSKSSYVYAKVRVGQGMWWANTNKPSMWMVNALRSKQIKEDVKNNSQIQILDVRSYPWWGSDQFDTYLTLKLKVTFNKKTGEYNFKRSAMGVGSPIDLDFPGMQLSGTVVDLKNKYAKDKYIEKNIYLVKRGNYSGYIYEGITIGDKYNDGVMDVFEVLDKSLGKNILTTVDNERESLSSQDITVKVKIKVKEKNNQFVFNEDQVVRVGKTLNISTSLFNYSDFIIRKIE